MKRERFRDVLRKETIGRQDLFSHVPVDRKKGVGKIGAKEEFLLKGRDNIEKGEVKRKIWDVELY